MIVNLIYIVLGLAGLYFGGEWLVAGAARIARSMGLSTLIIGLTIVAFGTSTPELLVSVTAALNNNSDIAVGNVVGSNIANIGLILGATGLIFPIAIHATLIKREIPILIIVTVGAAILAWDGNVTTVDGFILITGLIIFNGLMLYLVRQERNTIKDEEAEIEEDGGYEAVPPERIKFEVLRIIGGIVLLMMGARLTVDGATGIAQSLGVSDLVIGITLVAFGTSLPEMATSLVAAFRKQSDLVIGNIVGSNIYNLLGILSITAIIQPVSVDRQVVEFDGVVMVGFTLLLIPLVVTQRELSRREAIILLSLYTAFIIYTVVFH